MSTQMDPISNTLAGLMDIFQTRMADFEAQLQKAPADAPSISNLAADFSVFREFITQAVTSLQQQVELLANHIDYMEMRGRRGILLLHGIAEVKDEYYYCGSNEIVKKWRSVKDNFYKYLKKLKEASKSGSAAKKLKKYHFYNQVLFLTKVAQNETDSSLDVAGETNTDSTSDIAPESSRYVPITRKRTMQADDFEKEALKALKEPEDRHLSFFKGILPSIQDFTDLQTLTFQSKVLQIITEMRYGSMPQQSSSSFRFEQTSQQPSSHGYHTRSYRSTYTPTDLSSDCNLLPSPGETPQDSVEYDFANL